MGLQDQMNGYNRDLRLCQAKISALQREIRSGQVTSNYLETLKQVNSTSTASTATTSNSLYRSVGKAFIKTDPAVIEERLTQEAVTNTKLQNDLGGQKEFLERRIASTIQHMKDIAGVA